MVIDNNAEQSLEEFKLDGAARLEALAAKVRAGQIHNLAIFVETEKEFIKEGEKPCQSEFLMCDHTRHRYEFAKGVRYCASEVQGESLRQLCIESNVITLSESDVDKIFGRGGPLEAGKVKQPHEADAPKTP